MRYRHSLCSLVAVFLCLAGNLSGQAADTPRRDVVVFLDVSGSMRDDGKFAAVKDYLDRDVVNGLLKDGGQMTLFVFGDSVRERFNRSIFSASDRDALKQELRVLNPNDGFTDIGTAMEKLAEVVETEEAAGTGRVILFITDGLNAPPPGSKYRGADITLDERYKALGERISRGNWFLYVIGIGGRTAAQDMAGLIPGSELYSTGNAAGNSDGGGLDGLDVTSAIARQEEEARIETEKAAAEKAAAEALAGEEEAGFSAFLRQLAASMGIPLPVLIGAFILLLLIILLVLFLVRAFKTKELVITDEAETLIRRIPPLGGLTLNSPGGILPALGNENNGVLRIERGLWGISVKTMNSQALADNSPYRKSGQHPLKGVIGLANGRLVRITVR